MGHTLVTFHAHPDDDAIQCGGTMARAKAEGHRVVLVVATRGELGEIRAGVLTDGEALAERRVAETKAAAGDPRRRPGRVPRLPRLRHGGRGHQRRGRQLRRRRRRRGRDAPCSATRKRNTPTCSRSTTTTAATAIPITSRCTASASARPRSRERRVFEATMNRDHIKRLMALQPEALDDIAVEDRPDRRGHRRTRRRPRR